ncbi:hypothetical protein APHAL10511_006590 [Amanita phalloides]|nr:hypothetical protein APHAL10511_006590 [Amanita phalloides]
MLSINCFLLGHSSEVFVVKIPKTENVKILKILIKEQSTLLNHVLASQLTTWKVSLPMEAMTPELTVDEVEAQKLSPLKKKIFSFFDEALVDEHVHILVQVSADVNRAFDPTQLLSLNCIILGDDPKEGFTVKIPKTDNVSALKDLIKEKKKPRFDNVETSKLILSQVSLPLDDDLEESLKNVNFTPLDFFQLLSQVFPHVEKDHLHIVVQAPTNEGLGTEDAGEEEKRDRVNALQKRYNSAMLRILKAGTPAYSSKSSRYIKSQIAYCIYDGRYRADKPRTSIAPPVQLFHPAFGHFLDDMKSNHPLPDNIILQAVEYMKAATAIYESEEKHQKVLTPHLSTILGVNIQAIQNEDKMSPDGMVEGTMNKPPFLIFLQEDKNELGDGGSDPSTQAGLSAGRCWAQPKYKKYRDAVACPTFLLATAGPWFAILGAVITDGMIVQRLSNYLWVGLDSILYESHIVDVARAFYALRASLEKLCSFYKNLPVPTDGCPTELRYFPSITTYRSHGGGHVKFEYVGFLEDSPDCIVHRAQTETKPAQDIVVKFVERYGQGAHEILADQGFAPKLLYYGSPHLDDDEPSYGSTFMVVMEYIDGVMFAKAKEEMSEELLETVRSDVRSALELLHVRGLVFGDLRPPNVMITKADKVKLIDFNWAGVEGQAKYPPIMSPAIAWPEGVKALAVMRREHDLAMLDILV